VISDGQFQKAGFPEDRIVECHGSIHYLQCALPCSRGELAPAPASLDLAVDPETFLVRRVESSRVESNEILTLIRGSGGSKQVPQVPTGL